MLAHSPCVAGELVRPVGDKYVPHGLGSGAGYKKKDFNDFKKVAHLMESKHHLTEQGIKDIALIKRKMNSKRISN